MSTKTKWSGDPALVARLVDCLGGQSATAKIAGIKQQSVSYWIETGRVGPESVLDLEAAADALGFAEFNRFALRPDVFGVDPVQKVAS